MGGNSSKQMPKAKTAGNKATVDGKRKKTVSTAGGAVVTPTAAVATKTNVPQEARSAGQASAPQPARWTPMVLPDNVRGF